MVKCNNSVLESLIRIIFDNICDKDAFGAHDVSDYHGAYLVFSFYIHLQMGKND